ncbi:hypothetical protein G7085_13925 [Tessaracoccus sp. HDW20]|uniref:hypothetical protein n=1 Tax=Tessaracoccus coleopterorum TaxID=2714950 RepID=UPI0018D3688F|nr:hypothetical protein [Tessaracoccus coleopterorum]NHB85347.1 hypothetical protein [Tessaracoccus coleopterorum]
MHRRILRLWLSALLLGLVALFPTAALADVGVRVEVSATASRVTISGRLSGDAGQIRRRTVVASVDGTEVGRAKTQGRVGSRSRPMSNWPWQAHRYGHRRRRGCTGRDRVHGGRGRCRRPSHEAHRIAAPRCGEGEVDGDRPGLGDQRGMIAVEGR